MSRRLKKTMTVIIVVCMILFTGVDVFAVSAGSLTDGTITVHTGGRDVTGENFAVYKLMDCKKDGDKKIYDVAEDFTKFFEGENIEMKDAEDFAGKALKYLERNYVKADFQNKLREYIESETLGAAETLKGEKVIREYVTSQLRFGVYAIVPENKEQGIMVVKLDKAEKDAFLTGREPAITKSVEGKSWICSQIGEVISFEVVSSIPYMDGAENYIFKIEDTFSEALDLEKLSMNINVKIGENELEEGKDYSVQIEGRTLSIDFANFVQYKNLVGERVIVKYDTMLNGDADVKDVISNKANVYYGTNNNELKAGIPASVNIRTNQLNIETVDEPGVGLEDVNIELYKGKDVYGEAVKVVPLGNGQYKVAKMDDKKAVTKMSSNKEGKITVVGISDGNYSVLQTKSPNNFEAKTKTAMIHIDAMSIDNGFDIKIMGNDITMVSKAIKFSEKGKIMIGAVVVAVFIGLGYYVYSRKRREN